MDDRPEAFAKAWSAGDWPQSTAEWTAAMIGTRPRGWPLSRRKGAGPPGAAEREGVAARARPGQQLGRALTIGVFIGRW